MGGRLVGHAVVVSHRKRAAGDADQVGQGRGGRCLLYTSDAADDLLCVDLGGRRIIKQKTHK